MSDKEANLIESKREHQALKMPYEHWGSMVPQPGQIYPWSSQLLEPTYFLFYLS